MSYNVQGMHTFRQCSVDYILDNFILYLISGSAELVIQRRLWYTSFDDKSIWIHVRVS